MKDARSMDCAGSPQAGIAEDSGAAPLGESGKEDVDECLFGTSYEQRWEIISAYLEVLKKLAVPMGIESDLPYTKERIRLAIFQDLIENPNSEFRNQLEIAYTQLEMFIPVEDYKTIADFKRASLHVEEAAEPGDPASVFRLLGIMKRAKGDRAVKIQEAISEKMGERVAQIRDLGITVRVMNYVLENSGQACF